MDFQQNLVKYSENYKKLGISQKISPKSIDKVITICYNSGMNSLEHPKKGELP